MRTRDVKPSFPEYKTILTIASVVIVPSLVLAEVYCFLRDHRTAMRKLVAEIFDPRTRYEYELPLPSDLVRALEFDAKFNELHLGLVEAAAARSEKRAIGCRVPADNFYGLKHFAAAGRARFERCISAGTHL